MELACRTVIDRIPRGPNEAGLDPRASADCGLRSLPRPPLRMSHHAARPVAAVSRFSGCLDDLVPGHRIGKPPKLSVNRYGRSTNLLELPDSPRGCPALNSLSSLFNVRSKPFSKGCPLTPLNRSENRSAKQWSRPRLIFVQPETGFQVASVHSI